jgi:hypothetical protein
MTIHSSSKLVKTRNTEQKGPVGVRNGTRINTNSRLAFVSGKCGRHFVALRRHDHLGVTVQVLDTSKRFHNYPSVREVRKGGTKG